MTTASPSEFLTFMRHVVVRSSIRPQAIQIRPRASIPSLAASRPLHSSSRFFDIGKDTQHATRKSDQKDVQSESLGKAQQTRAKGGEDTTTSQKDHSDSTAKAHKEHPEAPDTIIGMQDERGGRGAYNG